MDLSRLALITKSPSEETQEFQKKFDLKLNPSELSSFEYVLEEKDQHWRLQTANGMKLEIDFDKNKVDYHRKNISKKDILIRAVGFKSSLWRVLDLTAGLGIDAVHLASMGCQVTSLERNPVLWFLLRQAQLRTQRSEIKAIRFLSKDANDFLQENLLEISNEFDVIYYDPMYPEKKKSALPRKEMQAFRSLVGADQDAEKVIQAGLESGIRRFVIKRPLKLPLQEYTREGYTFHNLEGTTVQYQVYVRGKNE